MIPTLSDLTAPPVVGKYYQVTCVRPWGSINGLSSSTWWPVIGPAHGDREIGVADEHWHYDARFLTVRQIAGLKKTSRNPTGWNAVFGYVLVTNPGQDFELRRRVCLREMPAHPSVNRLHGLLRASHRPLGPCLKCPHRGFDLRQIPVRDGLIVCPGHGLAWDAATLQPITTPLNT